MQRGKSKASLTSGLIGNWLITNLCRKTNCVRSLFRRFGFEFEGQNIGEDSDGRGEFEGKGGAGEGQLDEECRVTGRGGWHSRGVEAAGAGFQRGALPDWAEGLEAEVSGLWVGGLPEFDVGGAVDCGDLD